MAITYKSQGAGVSTETSGAALSPLCPAVVDAGDVLIAHVFWEGTATAPSTPGGWDLLSGPHVIQSTIARHWVFGKIAVGTEDGAAVAFGNPAVTTQRAARVYSFAGRNSGTITELVNGFAATSHATDPAMPTVTTTVAGALAVALVGQNDNNAFASPTGESGGDWVEAVAEYTAALTPGMSLGIETCTPTANPGTVSGGTMATTNDPCGVVGFQIMPDPPPAAHSIVGAVTVAMAVAATVLDFIRHASIIGAVAASATPAASTLDFTRHAAIVGAASVSVVPAATFQYGHAIVGAVTATATPAASMLYTPTSGASIIGAVTVTVTPTATVFDFTRHAGLVGSVLAQATPAATLDFTRHAAIAGLVAVVVTPAAALDLTRHAVLVGAITVSAVPVAVLVYARHASILGAATASASPAATFARGHVIWGNIFDSRILGGSGGGFL